MDSPFAEGSLRTERREVTPPDPLSIHLLVRASAGIGLRELRAFPAITRPTERRRRRPRSAQSSGTSLIFLLFCKFVDLGADF